MALVDCRAADDKTPLTDAKFFPLAVWLQDPANAPKFKDIGINIYAGLWRGPTEKQLAELMIIKDYHKTKEADPTRPVLLNLGQGVAWDNYIGRGVRRNHPEDYPEYIKGCDIASFDIYRAVHEHKDIAGLLADADMVAEIKKINQQIRELAPVLNGPAVEKAVQIESSAAAVPVEAMVRRHKDAT